MPLDPADIEAARSRSVTVASTFAPSMEDQPVRLPSLSKPKPEPEPESAPEVVEPEPEPVPVVPERVFVRGPGGGVSIDDATGRVWYPPQPELPPIPEPDEPVSEIAIDPSRRFGTSEGRLMAEGWVPPTDAIRETLVRREAMRFAMGEASRQSVNNPGLIGAGVVAGDPDAVLLAVTRNALDAWCSANLNGQEDSPVSRMSYDLEASWWALAYRTQRGILASLAGRHSPSAERLREWVAAMDGLISAPVPTRRADWVIVR